MLFVRSHPLLSVWALASPCQGEAPSALAVLTASAAYSVQQHCDPAGLQPIMRFALSAHVGAVLLGTHHDLVATRSCNGLVSRSEVRTHRLSASALRSVPLCASRLGVTAVASLHIVTRLPASTLRVCSIRSRFWALVRPRGIEPDPESVAAGLLRPARCSHGLLKMVWRGLSDSATKMAVSM